jgi:predicted hotdog family 3-hydroxylacyl-ACP dehydratase
MIEYDELLSLIPHKGKMLLLSRIMEYDLKKRTLSSEYDITPSCLFYDTGLDGVPSWVSFEFMAQSVSCLSGLTGRVMGREPQIGVILSVSGLELTSPVIRSKVVVHIVEDVQLDSVFTFNGEVYSDTKQVASAKITVMDIANPELFFKTQNPTGRQK